MRGAVGDERHFGVGMEVDEARRDDEARGINRLRGGASGERTDRLHPVAANADIGAHRRRAGAVKHLAAGDENVKRRILRRCARQHRR